MSNVSHPTTTRTNAPAQPPVCGKPGPILQALIPVPPPPGPQTATIVLSHLSSVSVALVFTSPTTLSGPLATALI